jgi:hypothetical protein
VTDARKILTKAEMEWRATDYNAWLRAKALEDEREGRSIVMPKPDYKPKPASPSKLGAFVEAVLALSREWNCVEPIRTRAEKFCDISKRDRGGFLVHYRIATDTRTGIATCTPCTRPVMKKRWSDGRRGPR